MKLNRFHKRVIQGIIDNRKGVYDTPKRKVKGVPYKECKEWSAALELMLNRHIKAQSANEHGINGMFEGPATPEPEYRWFSCSPWKTKRELKKLLTN